MHWHRSLMVNLDHREIMMKRFPARWGNWGSALLSSWLVTSGNRMELNNVHLWFLCSFILSGRSFLLGDQTPWPWVANLQKSKVGHPPTHVYIWSTLSFVLVSLTDYRGVSTTSKSRVLLGRNPLLTSHFDLSALPPKHPSLVLIFLHPNSSALTPFLLVSALQTKVSKRCIYLNVLIEIKRLIDFREGAFAFEQTVIALLLHANLANKTGQELGPSLH